MERENLAGDAKGKGASGSNREAESTDAPERGGLPRSSDEGPVMGLERRRWVIAADVGQLVRREEPLFSGRRQPSCDGTSRMMREYPVRICEGLGVKFLGPTRQSRRFDAPPATSGLPQSTNIARPARLVRFVPNRGLMRRNKLKLFDHLVV